MIDKHIQRPWPDKVGKALADIRQGDVVKAPPFFYAHGGKTRLWDVPAEDEADETAKADGDDAQNSKHGQDNPGGTNGSGEGGAARDEESDEDEEPDEPASAVEEIHPADAPPFGIITSQTCDLDEQGPKPGQVWFQVSPVYPVPKDPDEKNRLLSKQYTVQLNGDGLPAGDWVADLRIELPIEKSWLVDKKRARVDKVTSSIRKRKQVKTPAGVKTLARTVWTDDVYRVLLAIEGGTRLKPVAVKLHVVCTGEPTTRAKAWFEDWEDEARHEADAVGIELHKTEFHDARKVDLHQYDRWVELDFG